MDKDQEKEWVEAQEIVVSVDLVEAAKRQLKFLAAVDRNRYLYEDHALQWAIYRYNAFWLPLLAKHLENPVSEDPLVVPLDCEWIWHCHRLNPIRYKLDCEKLYARILGKRNVVSSVQATSKIRTEEIWNKMYPEEPYELDINRSFSEVVLKKGPRNEKFTNYDLISAVKRQISFTFQVSRSHMSDDLFLQEAEARYKGFLHLIRTNRKLGVNRFCVPTYDIDLMWHTHQLHPYYYCKDLITILGKVLEHDDTDSDRTQGSKLDTGFSETVRQWEEIFGKRYWKAGAMYRGNTPIPVTQVPSEFKFEGKEINPMGICDKTIQLSATEAVEVFLEFVEIKNLPEGHKDNLVVSFSKKQSDKLFDVKRSLSIFSESGEKQIAYFQCEPTGEFLFELKSQSRCGKLIPKSSKVLGSCSLSLQELLASRTQLSADKWLSVEPVSGIRISKPILLHFSVSFTPPTPAPQVFYLELSRDSRPFFKSSCLPLLKTGKVKDASTQTYVTDDDGEVVFSLQMSNTVKDVTNYTRELLKEVHYITNSGEKHQVAEFRGKNWVIKGMHGLFMLQNSSGNDGHLFELIGNKMVKLFPGRRLDSEPKHFGNRHEQDFITAVEFSADHPYGRSIALIDLKLGTVKAQDKWIVLPGIILGFILSEIISREGYSGFIAQNGDKVSLNAVITDDKMQAQVLTVTNKCNIEKENACVPEVKTGGCGGGCSGGGCLSIVESSVSGCGTCGSECGGNMVKSSGCGGCGAGCGGGCGGNMVKSSGCGGCGAGCGGGCGGNMVKSSGCGGCGGGGCGSGCGGNMAKSSGCGGCGGGGCGGVSGRAESMVIASHLNELVAA